MRLICKLSKTGLEKKVVLYQSIHFHIHSQDSFLLHCAFPQLTELKDSSKVMKIREPHGAERCALNNASFATGEIQ